MTDECKIILISKRKMNGQSRMLYPEKIALTIKNIQPKQEKRNKNENENEKGGGVGKRGGREGEQEEEEGEKRKTKLRAFTMKRHLLKYLRYLKQN